MPTQHSHRDMLVQTVVTQGLQIANDPWPCRTGLDPGWLEKGQDWSFCAGSYDGNPDIPFILLAPTGTYVWRMGTQGSLSRSYFHGPHLPSFTHIPLAAANSSRTHCKPITQTGSARVCVHTHACVYVCINIANGHPSLLHRHKPRGFSEPSTATRMSLFSPAPQICRLIFQAQLF